MAEDFDWLNPHLSLSVTWNGKRCLDLRASDPAWAKWGPSNPTSPHWYDEALLRRPMGAYITRDQDRGRDPRTVREFVGEFRGRPALPSRRSSWRRSVRRGCRCRSSSATVIMSTTRRNEPKFTLIAATTDRRVYAAKKDKEGDHGNGTRV